MTAATDSALTWASSRTRQIAVPWVPCLQYGPAWEREGELQQGVCLVHNPRTPDFYADGENAQPMVYESEPIPVPETIFGTFTGGGGSIAPAYILGQLAEIAVAVGLPRTFDWMPYLALAAQEHFTQFGRVYDRYETAYAYPINVAAARAAAEFPALARAVDQTGYGSEFWSKLEAWRAAVKHAHETANRNHIITAVLIVAAPLLAMYFAPAASVTTASTASASGAGSAGVAELGLVADVTTAEAAIAGGIEAGTLAGGSGALTLADVAALELASAGQAVSPGATAPASTAPAAPGALEQAGSQVLKAGTALVQRVFQGLLGTAAAKLVNGSPENQVLPQEHRPQPAPAGQGLGALLLPAAAIAAGLLLKG